MTIIRDFQNRAYKLVECGSGYTLLECMRTGDRVRVGASMFKETGFVKP